MEHTPDYTRLGPMTFRGNVYFECEHIDSVPLKAPIKLQKSFSRTEFIEALKQAGIYLSSSETDETPREPIKNWTETFNIRIGLVTHTSDFIQLNYFLPTKKGTWQSSPSLILTNRDFPGIIRDNPVTLSINMTRTDFVKALTDSNLYPTN
ncbi:hypothetical protein [Candidatus Odyssella acanthamoebae]|uniref:Uncharacterized protein n=1 Tax=Candidatus Odyssella acanthamoebae TaxID=91604 RepID=A0A077B0J5_9PROT|nr:hypothetical protein [Candidatus Paracaedibacter acanthamoebae]AIK96435.1 hypothetical protein ID47_06310 [Candidatus Paracaedibacter acanthamoebae]